MDYNPFIGIPGGFDGREPRRINVALADEHEVVRAGLRDWLTAPPLCAHVAGEFADPLDYLAWAQAAPPVDVVVMEIQVNGYAPDLERLRAVRRTGAPVVIYSRIASDEVILAGIEAGATTYVCKSEDRTHVIEAVRSTAAGRAHVGPAMAEAIRRGNTVGRIALSDREREVLVAWFRTESKDDVGRMLHISTATVRTHLQRIRAKYAEVNRPASTKCALLARAVEDGYIGLSELNCEMSSALANAERSLARWD